MTANPNSWKVWPDRREADLVLGGYPDGLRIKILTLNGYSWSLHCRDIGMDGQSLKAGTLEVAQEEALALIRARLKALTELVA